MRKVEDHNWAVSYVYAQETKKLKNGDTRFVVYSWEQGHHNSNIWYGPSMSNNMRIICKISSFYWLDYYFVAFWSRLGKVKGGKLDPFMSNLILLKSFRFVTTETQFVINFKLFYGILKLIRASKQRANFMWVHIIFHESKTSFVKF